MCVWRKRSQRLKGMLDWARKKKGEGGTRVQQYSPVQCGTRLAFSGEAGCWMLGLGLGGKERGERLMRDTGFVCNSSE